MSYVQTIALAAQIACFALANLPGIGDAAKGALLLTSFWFLGANVGIYFASKRIEGDR